MNGPGGLAVIVILSENEIYYAQVIAIPIGGIAENRGLRSEARATVVSLRITPLIQPMINGRFVQLIQQGRSTFTLSGAGFALSFPAAIARSRS
jgi:hypothetical protein